MSKRARVGVIGCGQISHHYLTLGRGFPGMELTACADIAPDVAKARAKEFAIAAMTVDELLKSDEIDVVINLTVPSAHYAISQAILTSGKHAYSEKPLAMTYEQARRLVSEADERGLKIGAAPDTFLGAAAQLAVRKINSGAIGAVLGGSAFVMSHGDEHSHPNPGFFYRPGGGPLLDMGPYYITMLVALLGPVSTVAAMQMKGFAERIVTSAPRFGERIKVEVPTTNNAVLEFHSGSQVIFGTSWDVWHHTRGELIELYGTEGTMILPDPNFFGGIIRRTIKAEETVAEETSERPFGRPNWPGEGSDELVYANYRSLGVAELVDAVANGREPRCSGRLAAHVVDVMESISLSASERSFVKLSSKVERPAALSDVELARLGQG